MGLEGWVCLCQRGVIMVRSAWVDPALTCFDPLNPGALAAGLDFHAFVFSGMCMCGWFLWQLCADVVTHGGALCGAKARRAGRCAPW